MADPRYSVEAYEFLCQALAYTQQVVRPDGTRSRPSTRNETKSVGPDDRVIQHVTGQDLCEGIRRFALDQFGLMAPTVFRCWGVRETSDFGKMVYHLIESGLWHKSESDSIEDFSDQFDLDTAFTAEAIDWHAQTEL